MVLTNRSIANNTLNIMEQQIERRILGTVMNRKNDCKGSLFKHEIDIR